MPKLAEVMSRQRDDEGNLRAFLHHGVDLHEHNSQHNGECPFCGKDKFTVQTETGVWRCWVCGRTGNPLEFLRQLWAASEKTTDDGWLRKLADDRTLLHHSTLQQWGACKSIIGGNWLIPGYNTKGELFQLYKRVQTANSEGVWTWKLLPTPGVWPEGKAHALHLPKADFDPNRSELYICEGPWDGMAFWEIARQCKRENVTMELCNQRSSMLADANVIAVPGCNVWQDAWTELCRGKHVALLYDNDHPNEHAGTITMAGFDGLKRVAGRIGAIAKSVSFLQWGEAGFDPALKSGFDVRDALAKGIS